MNRSALLSLAACLFFSGCGKSPENTAAAPMAADSEPVQVAVAERTALTRFQDVPGTVRAVSRATLAAQVMGRVETSRIAVGQTVSAGEELLTIRAEQIAAQVEQARAALDLATSDHDRESRLLAQGASTADLVRSLEDRRRIAAAALDAVQAQLAYTRVTAPFDGVITQRHVEPGDLASPGTPLFAIEGRDAYEVEVAVPDSLPFIGVGATVDVNISDRHVAGVIREASPAAVPTTRTRLVRIALPTDAGARSGQYVRAQWPDRGIEVVTVPTTAIVRFGQMHRVFVVSDGVASLRLVRPGEVTGDRTVILAGVSPGETVVVNPPAALRDDQPVAVAP